MNENRKLELERFFDGELPPDEFDRVERELIADTEGARYVERLGRLRQLATSDAAVPIRVSARPVVVSFPRRESRRNKWVAVASGLAAAAAGIAALVWWSNQHEGPTGEPRLAKRAFVSNELPRPKPAESEPVRPSSAAPLALDAQRHVWANGEMPSPAVAARLVLDRAAEPTRPTPAEAEILALELANSNRVSAGDIVRAVTERTNVIRHPPARNRNSRRPARSPPSTQRDRPGDLSIAELTDFLRGHVG